jgi:transglutaminase-like putative cysteine protease
MNESRTGTTTMTGTRELFTASLYALVCLAAMMLAIAEGNWLLPAALTLPIALAAYNTVERRGHGFSNLAANGLGVLAIIVALIELAVRDIEGRLLFGAHLLVYLSWILLWQRKGAKQHWGLLALSVLQVAVGAVLTNSGYFGMAMAAFLALSVWTLILLQLLEAEKRHVATHGLAPAPEAGSPRILLAGGSVASAGQAAFGRWPFRQLAAALVVTLAGATAVGGAFFLLVPRFEFGRHNFDETDTPLARQRRTGFTDRVRLGSFGEILESSVPVFDVRLFEGRDDVPIDVEQYAAELGLDEPLFRGATLSEYENGEWQSDFRGDTTALLAKPLPNYVRQEYRLEPMGSQTLTLFAIAPVRAGEIEGTDQPIRRAPETGTLYRPSDRRRRGEISYKVFSPRTGDRRSSRNASVDLRAYLQLPEDLGKLRAVSADVGRADEPAATPRIVADRLLEFLRDSGTYSYSLSGELSDPSLDPVEDFLVNRKAGHCEYFASALALMLRAEGVPSRVVTGFKGGERNRLNGSFEVQQRHAHAWVEALINGRWETLDPTPVSARNSSVDASAPRLPLWNDFRSSLGAFWQSYVVELNLGRQRATLAPLRQAGAAIVLAFRDDFWPSLRQLAYSLATDPSHWFSWQGGVVTFIGLLIAVGLWRLALRIKRRLARLRAAQAARRRFGRRVEFYERFRALCKRRGWIAGPTTTAREFAVQIAEVPAVTALAPRLTALPAELAEDFYRVRFGEEDLSDETVADLDRRLTEFEAALAERAKR